MTATGSTVDLVQISGVIGAALPIVVAVFKQDRFSPMVNTIIAVAVAALAALITVGSRENFGLGNVATSFVTTYTTAMAFYHGLWKPIGIAPRVQTRTSAVPRHHPARRDLSRC